MEDEAKKTENSTAEDKKSTTAPDPQPNILESLGPILKFFNQPGVASVGAAAVLYWLIDPKGLKAAMEEVKSKTDDLIDAVNEQTEEIESLKKQLARKRRSDEDENDEQEKDLNGYRKAKRKGSVF